MRFGYPQPNVAQLRLGLHLLVLALAVVVLLRALALDEDRAWATSLLVGVFLVAYVVRTRLASEGLRLVVLGLLVATWVGLVLLGSDAAYVSVALFLVFLTELAFWPALGSVIAVTAFDALVGVARGGAAPALVVPALGAMLSVLVGIGYRVLFDATTAQSSLIGQLQETRAELAKSERAAGQAAERERLAREIHDTVAQGLSSIHLLLHAAEAEPLSEQVRERLLIARRTAASSLSDARRMVAELAPADLADSSLSAALRRICERSSIDVRFVNDGEPEVVPMPVQAALVRIAQSALANVEQHAGAGARAVVSLNWSGDRVSLDVVDDGRGFDLADLATSAVPSFGLNTIRHRVADLGGEFTVESEPGHTALAVSFSLEPRVVR